MSTLTREVKHWTVKEVNEECGACVWIAESDYSALLALLRQREEEKRIADALMLEGSQKIDELRAQLADSVARRHETVAMCHQLQGELATAVARCAELSDGIKLIALHIEATSLCEINPYDILKTCKELLTPTERPPA